MQGEYEGKIRDIRKVSITASLSASPPRGGMAHVDGGLPYNPSSFSCLDIGITYM